LFKTPEVAIVDDDASVRTAVSRLVRSLGYVAHAFSSAEEFLKSQELDSASCLIADVQMPRMSGLALQNLLRNQNRHLPIIFITAFPEENIRLRAMHAGAVSFLTKPLDGQTLIKQIHRAIADDL
jgi:FixJ family two-component response regulator